MKTSKSIIVLFFTIVLVNLAGLVSAQSGDPWTTKDLMEIGRAHV